MGALQDQTYGAKQRMPPATSRRRRLRSAMRAAGEVIAETLWPTRCAICDEPGRVLCDDCVRSIRPIDVVFACQRCGSPNSCIQCSECNDVSLGALGLSDFPFTRFASAVQLTDDTKRIITVYKDHDEHRLAPFIARTMCRYIDPDWLDPPLRRLPEDDRPPSPLHVSFIPSTAEARRRRGFDHMEEIAQLVARSMDLPLAPLFERPKNKDQRKLSRRGRMKNMSEQFRIRTDAKVPDRVLLIDDISTTGSTLFGAALALRRAGVVEVYGLTFGKVY